MFDIAPIFKEQTITETEGNKKEKKKKTFFGHWDPNCNTSNKTIQRPNRTQKNQHRQGFQKVQHIPFTKRKQIQIKKRLFWAKQLDTVTPEDHWEKVIE